VVSLTIEIGGEIKKIIGRDAWALFELISAGTGGVTPIERPAPRWSHYCWKLRRAGISIETIDEKHGGALAGTHARYMLRASVRVIEVIRQNDAKRGVRIAPKALLPYWLWNGILASGTMKPSTRPTKRIIYLATKSPMRRWMAAANRLWYGILAS
jgi:hypothetical protein